MMSTVHNREHLESLVQEESKERKEHKVKEETRERQGIVEILVSLDHWVHLVLLVLLVLKETE